jgi:endonuclease/exonuclease/phosphatase family metal-dependent hydrolase
MSHTLQLRLRFIWACVFACAMAATACAELPKELRVLTYNIHHGEGTDGEFDLPRIANVIKIESPDLVALQEVDQATARASGVDQPAELARLTGMQVVFGRNIDYEGGGYGTAVLSRLPIKAHSSVKLRSFYEPTSKNAEQRGVQVVEIGEPGESGLVFLCTHLDYRPDDRERMASAEAINQLAAKYGNRSMILAGDLNAEPDSRVMREFTKRWKITGAPEHEDDSAPLPLTFPSGEPVKWIDCVLVRPADRWEVVEVRVLNERVASDHRPLLAVLRRVE